MTACRLPLAVRLLLTRIVYRRTATMRKAYIYGPRRTLHFGRINGRWSAGVTRR